MRRYLNGSNLPLSMAVFLATDDYDYDDRTNVISATSLIKPLRQTVLSARLSPEEQAIDVLQRVNSRIGQAIHSSVEQSWLNGVDQALEYLGYPKKVRERIRVNPDPDSVGPDAIPVYLEQRSEKPVGQYIVSGKYDFVGDGRLEDVKSTKTFTWINNTKDEGYILQGSIYRWLNPKIITRDEMAIQFIFTDWSAGMSKGNPKYPPYPVMEKTYPLMPLPQIDNWIRNRIAELERYWDAEEDQLPLCSDKELWRSDPVWKYYKDPTKTARSTKNFDNPQDARLRNAEDGGKGLVLEVKGQVSACKYCPAFTLCSQKDALVADGSLQV